MRNHLMMVSLVGIMVVTACDAGFTGTPAADIPTIGINAPIPLQSVLHVVYIKNGDAWLWIEGSPGRQITNMGCVQQVAISNDGEVIAFECGDELYAINAEGTPEETKPRWLMDRNYLQSLSPVVKYEVKIGSFGFSPGDSPGGHFLFLNTFTIGGIGNEDLFRINADNGIPVRVFPPGEGGTFSLSRDGQWIAFSQPNKLILGHSDGTDMITVDTFPPLSGFGTREIPEFIWGSDGFFTITPVLDSVDQLLGIKQLAYVSHDGVLHPVMEINAPLYTETHISPDGQRVAYVWDNGDLKDLHIVDSRVDNDFLFSSYPSDNFGFLDWTPDSEHFVVWLNDYSRQYTVYRPLITSFTNPGFRFLTNQDAMPETLRWIDSSRYLYVGLDGRLILGRCSEAVCPEQIAEIDTFSASPEYGFALVSPC